ncbi:MAG: hypothetical protein A3B10_02915 [Candidatus Doudnabacteria bacterium RIFCSPLOWO2_01_FULL_44_21]|uniref:Uncharacterized protein n=1 Tax=Candidatus Doudnabacteria bacterium RIFCSPLOWO2_01_FULL_44_21 TaxID=1817841 RepID=A0A1F5Q221_9BACT|nr:MAG: hypothetical protein A3B95_03180 [Candidatus Doudnabacteria bacterium RIFCSPHIGHO2_02_FULL_43_13b]OGE96239.1 MAG: hypothetical protein A3B10_02915 [Candidatus Doudnabacteria bacterium RIFCSPLOWO2_01_FULL_44_21]
MKDFTMIPNETYEAFLCGEITLSEWAVLIWIYQKSNPTKGRSVVNYPDMVSQFKPLIKYDNARKILSSLRKHKWVYFKPHRGSGGAFPVYPCPLMLSSGQIQVIDRVTGERKVIDDPDPRPKLRRKRTLVPPNSSQLSSSNHNSDKQNAPSIKGQGQLE